MRTRTVTERITGLAADEPTPAHLMHGANPEQHEANDQRRRAWLRAWQCAGTKGERPMKIRARWNGPSPKVGDYLMSQVRPRFAYRISAVDCPDRLVGWDPGLKSETRRLVIEAVRVSVAAVPAAARVHPWRWDKRDAKPRRGDAG